MRHQHMARIAAVDRNAEMTRRRAQILLAVPAGWAGAAADPRIDRDLAARRRDGIRRDLRSGAFDHACNLVAERERQGSARRNIQLLVADQSEKAVLHVEVGVADAASLDSHQHFAAARLRAVDDGFDQRRPIGDEGLAVKLGCHASSDTAAMWPPDNTVSEIENIPTTPRKSASFATVPQFWCLSCTTLCASTCFTGGERK